MKVWAVYQKKKKKKNHTPKAYIHKNLTLNHTPKLNPNCHIQSIKTNTATKALPNIQSEIRNEKLGHQKVQTLIEIGEDACGSRSSLVLLT